MRAIVMTHTHKGHGQRSLGANVRMETDGRKDGRTDGDYCITSRANVVGNNRVRRAVIVSLFAYK